MKLPTIPQSSRLAVLLPTARWDSMTQAVIGMMIGVASCETVVLIADNSENSEKREFLEKITLVNNNILSVSHDCNIGGKANLLFLYDWASNIEFVSQIADDDWMSPTYHYDSYKFLSRNPDITCCEVGTTFVDIGDGKLANVSQPSMTGNSVLERLKNWNCNAARVTMFNTSRRKALDAAIWFFRNTPLPGLTMAEDLWELNRLALGGFASNSGPGAFIHYPENGSSQGDPTMRFYSLLCKDVGLAYPFVFFMGLSTAIQCAIFLLGERSPIIDPSQRMDSAQHVFSHIFLTSFLPRVATESSQAAALSLFVEHPQVARQFTRYCGPPFSLKPRLDREFLNWFIELLTVFESKRDNGEEFLSTQFSEFANGILNGTL